MMGHYASEMCPEKFSNTQDEPKAIAWAILIRSQTTDWTLYQVCETKKRAKQIADVIQRPNDDSLLAKVKPLFFKEQL